MVGMKIEDDALIGDLQTAALVGRDGSVDWPCLPRFDSPSCCTALLGDESHGRWLLAPATGETSVSRRYRPGTLVLEDRHATSAELTVAEGASERFVLTWHPSHLPTPPVEDADSALARTTAFWSDWIMHGVGGERRLDELDLDWLPGYEGSAPVRVGNAASGQFQLDVYGEVVGVFRREGQFRACSFRLVNAPATDGRLGESRQLFERLLSLSNDLGLLAEEYDVARQRQVGNFPQASSHLALVSAAAAVTAAS
jgi:GH15 family glucan-1,4-alpha-glucosidase